MSQIKDLLDVEIYPALYGNIGYALPEFKFKQTRGGYVSTTDHKITGDSGKAGKVYVYANNITRLIDYTRGSVSIWDYIQRRDSLSDNGEVVKRLAELAGVTLPPLDQETQDRIKKAVTRAQIWEDANSYFIYCLNSDSKKAQDVKTYLLERGYTAKDIEKMELGYIPSQKQLYTYLTEKKGYDKATVEEEIKLHTGIGATHLLTIPYRDPVGKIKGIAVRAIKPDAEPKYLYSTGLKRGEILFNLRAVKGEKDLIIVEGLLDSLIATARGADNVVALGSSSINKTQIETALRYGAKMFTLCLDNDTAGRDGTLRALDLLRDQERVYVAQLPEGVKDPDELITSDSILSFIGVLAEPLPYWQYTLQHIYKKYTDIAERNEDRLTEKEKDSLLEEIVAYGQTINSPVDRDQYLKQFTAIDWVQTKGITQESLQDTVETLRYKADVEKQGRELKKLQDEAKKLQETGDHTGAIELLEAGLKGLKIQRAKDLLPDYYGYQDWRQEIATTPLGLKTGIGKLDKIVTIPQGAITLIAGRPSHGKTTLLFNLLLSIAQKYGDAKKFYFFTYEEPKKLILAKILNRLIDTDLIEADPHYSVSTNLEYLRNYLRDHRTDRAEIEQGGGLLNSLLESGKITVVDQSYTVEQLGAIIRHLHRTEPVGAVFIDYIQRMSTERKTQDKRTEIAHISDSILQTAKDTGLPIILGSQLRRGAGDSPLMENLKEAGNLEEDANLVLSVFNESVEKEKERGESYGRVVDLEIKTLKNRDGEPNKKVYLSFDRWTLKITDTQDAPF